MAWVSGKGRLTRAYARFPARRAQRLPWKEAAQGVTPQSGVTRCADVQMCRCAGHPMWMLRAHRALLLNRFRAKGRFSSGVVEGFNTKAKSTSGKSFGFRACHDAETALYPVLGVLPEPESTHRFYRGAENKARRKHAHHLGNGTYRLRTCHRHRTGRRFSRKTGPRRVAGNSASGPLADYPGSGLLGYSPISAGQPSWASTRPSHQPQSAKPDRTGHIGL